MCKHSHLLALTSYIRTEGLFQLSFTRLNRGEVMNRQLQSLRPYLQSLQSCLVTRDS